MIRQRKILQYDFDINLIVHLYYIFRINNTNDTVTLKTHGVLSHHLIWNGTKTKN